MEDGRRIGSGNGSPGSAGSNGAALGNQLMYLEVEHSSRGFVALVCVEIVCSLLEETRKLVRAVS